MSKILVCDDDREIVDAIAIYLEREGYDVVKAYDGEEAIKVIEGDKIDLLIIDVMMPKLGGVEATFKIRENNSLPIIILSAKSEDKDKIFGLRVGADDYMTKPFNPLELIARVQSQLRRSTVLNQKSGEEEEIYQKGGLVLNNSSHQVTVDGEMIKLTGMEYDILHLLIKNRGRTFTSDEIYERVWNEDSCGSSNVVSVHVRHIREKIEINPKKPQYIQVVWGVGYRMEK